MEQSQTAYLLDRVKAFNDDTIRKQLQCMMEEDDIDAFIQFLRKLKDFGKKSPDQRHMLLVDLAFFKSQIQKFEAQVKAGKEKEKLKLVQESIKKAKLSGAKITENVITEFTETTTLYENLEQLHIIAQTWKDYMSDLYFMCQQTNKIIDNFN